MTKPPALLALLALLSLPAPARADGVVSTSTMQYKSGGEKVTGILTRPVGGAKKKPGIVVIHEWWGLNDFAKKKAGDLAALGFVALAVDLYRGKVATDPDTAHQLARGLPQDRALRDLRAAIDALSKDGDVDPARIGVIGWCMGGGFSAELAAADPRVKAAVVYYGPLPTDEKKLAGWKAALLGNFGADDKGIPADEVRAFAAALQKRGVVADVKVYPGAGHAFASSSKPETFKAEAAKDADERTAAFLKAQLRP